MFPAAMNIDPIKHLELMKKPYWHMIQAYAHGSDPEQVPDSEVEKISFNIARETGNHYLVLVNSIDKMCCIEGSIKLLQLTEQMEDVKSLAMHGCRFAYKLIDELYLTYADLEEHICSHEK